MYYPNSCCDGKQALLVLLVDGVCKFDQNYVGQEDCVKLKTSGRTTDNGVAKRSQAGLSLLDDTDGFRAVLSRDLDAHEKSLSFTYGRPEES